MSDVNSPFDVCFAQYTLSNRTTQYVDIAFSVLWGGLARKRLDNPQPVRGRLRSAYALLNFLSGVLFELRLAGLFGPIPWGHSGPLCHALSLSSLWTSHAACAIAIAGVRLATPDD